MNNKDTIYIDIDDEITTIIDKVQNSASRIVALVLPKRASVLQSVVNMKLLKRSADTAKKQVVLITSEAGLLPLAGTVGLYVASSLQSKPSLPKTTLAADDIDDLDEPIALEDDFDPKAAAAVPVGALNKTAPTDEPPAKLVAEPETIDLDEPLPAAAAPAVAKKKVKPSKKLAVPNFLRFRKGLALAIVGLVVLLVGGYAAAVVLPKADITVVTETSPVVATGTLTLSVDQDSVEAEDGLVPARVETLEAKTTQQATASGEKNTGERAHGSVTVRNCTGGSIVLTAGTGLSNGDKTYILQQTLRLDEGNFTKGGACQSSGDHTGTGNVTAQAAGSSYNIENGTSLTVASNGAFDASDVVAVANGTIGGGSDNVIKVIAQSDIDGAKAKLAAADGETARADLAAKLEAANLTPITATFSTADPVVTTSANAGDQADAVTVTQTVTYRMFGVTDANLETLVAELVKDDIDSTRQTIQSTGLDDATFKLVGTPGDKAAQVDFRATATAGPKLNPDDLKTSIAGLKSGQVEETLQQNPGVDSVVVKLSPFWVTSVPSDPTKVTITLQEANSSSND